jgi:1-acyl-sn-glycerol-3-phosphate acyltransferase
VKHLFAFWALLRGITHALHGLLILRWHFGAATQAQKDAHIQWWAAKMLRIMGIDLHSSGVPAAQGPVMFVANHVSWIDILVIQAVRPVRFVSKAEVQRWPLIGPIVSGAGTLYLTRQNKRDSLRIVQLVRDALLRGEMVAVFPEGTTSAGHDVKPFHGNMLQAAIDAHALVQPAVLRYTDVHGQLALAPAYIDNDTFVATLWRTLTTPGLRVSLHVLQPEAHTEPGPALVRRDWALRLQGRVREALLKL